MRLLDGGQSHGVILGWLATAQLAVVAIVLLWFPETAHHELEDLNPIDRDTAQVGVSVTADHDVVSGLALWPSIRHGRGKKRPV